MGTGFNRRIKIRQNFGVLCTPWLQAATLSLSQKAQRHGSSIPKLHCLRSPKGRPTSEEKCVFSVIFSWRRRRHKLAKKSLWVL